MSIVLSSGVRQNLLSLQNTSEAIGTIQNRLATGLRVSSALDNPSNFFTASGLNNRASDLSNLLDSIGQGIQTLKAADEGIKGITKLVEQAKSTANSAKETSSATERATLATTFDSLRTQINQLAGDSSYKGKNLINGTGATNNLVVNFNEDGTSSLTISAVDLTTTGLSISAAAGNFATDANVDASITELDAALSSLRSQSATFGSNLGVVENRENFTKNLINTLEEGAGKLTLADTNEEGANLLALQTRQQLSSVALSLASQADQNVLRLF
jgi:flagellin-like hook-associated protein FlgL